MLRTRPPTASPARDDDDDDEVTERFKWRLAILDKAHAQAQTPKQRRRIERKIDEVHHEMARLVELEKGANLAFQRWVASLHPKQGTA